MIASTARSPTASVPASLLQHGANRVRIAKAYGQVAAHGQRRWADDGRREPTFNNGQIVVNGYNNTTGQNHAFLLTATG
jgi:hypothetical protein